MAILSSNWVAVPDASPWRSPKQVTALLGWTFRKKCWSGRWKSVPHVRREARERVHLVQGDMTEFDLEEKFRTILIPFRPFQHLLETEQQMGA